MSPEDLAVIAEKLRKLHWLEVVHSTFIHGHSKAGKELQKELLETRRLQVLCEKGEQK